RLGARPLLAVEREAGSVALREEHVVEDDAGTAAGEEVEQRRMHEPWPWPPAHDRLERFYAPVVYRHDDDVAAGRGGVGRGAHAPVVGLELDRLDERQRA